MTSVIRGNDDFDSAVLNEGSTGEVLTKQSDGTSQFAAAPTGSTTFGDVGTYVLANRGDDLNTITQGTTYAGSGLYPTGFQAFVYAYSGGQASNRSAGVNSSAIGSGTWRAMGRTPNQGGLYYYYPANLFVRVS